MSTISIYSQSVPVFSRQLRNMIAVLKKAQTYAEAKKVDETVLASARLFPDMFPLSRQVQIMCDMVKGAVARLAGQEPPSWADDETTIAQLIARIEKTSQYVEQFTETQFAGAETRAIELKMRTRTVNFSNGVEYLTLFVVPNFYFHATTTYALLRHNGVEIGKADFLGA